MEKKDILKLEREAEWRGRIPETVPVWPEQMKELCKLARIGSAVISVPFNARNLEAIASRLHADGVENTARMLFAIANELMVQLDERRR